ncbi:sensor histidine kinase [Nonomuraea sp. NPDC050404]|uniref:sensor histidine kinase n=1 Tax=Nonomuraea sp. NPDC050404 TaxID=3155783 RepID=UPI0033DC02AB
MLDLALAVITVIGVVTGIMAAELRQSPWSGTFQFALFLGVVLLLRRRWPMVVLLLSIAATFVFHFTSLFQGGWIWPASAAYFSAACTPWVRWVAAIGVAQLGYEAVYLREILAENVPRFLTHVLGEGLLLAALVAAGLVYAAAARWRERLRESEGRTRAAEERLRLSREVHDIVAHTLAVVGVQLNVAADALDEEDPAEAADALRVAKDVRNRAMADLRSLIGVLRDDPGGPAPQPDLATLGDLIENARAAGLRVTLDERGDPSNVPAAPAVAVYRIVQEALTNTLKHANATAAEVRVGYGPRSVTVEVEDDGRGCARIAEGHGLTGMRGRVGALNGTLSVESTPGGFTVRAEIPVAGSLT